LFLGRASGRAGGLLVYAGGRKKTKIQIGKKKFQKVPSCSSSVRLHFPTELPSDGCLRYEDTRTKCTGRADSAQFFDVNLAPLQVDVDDV